MLGVIFTLINSNFCCTLDEAQLWKNYTFLRSEVLVINRGYWGRFHRPCLFQHLRHILVVLLITKATTFTLKMERIFVTFSVLVKKRQIVGNILRALKIDIQVMEKRKIACAKCGSSEEAEDFIPCKGPRCSLVFQSSN